MVYTTWCKNRINFGCTEYSFTKKSGSKRFAKKMKKWKNNFKGCDFLENAKFMSGLTNGYFLFEKR